MDFSTILSEYRGLLTRVANSYEENPELQQELFQEISIAVWQALDKFKQQSSVKTYILKIAHNRAVSHVSKEVRTIHSSNSDHAELDTLLASNQSMETQIETNEQLRNLLTAVRKLKLPARQIFTMNMEGLSYQEIAQNTGTSISNVGAIISRAKTSVLKEMSDAK